MIRTTIKHGPLHIELCEDGCMQLAHEKTGHSIRLSKSEWAYLQAVAALHGWPIACATDIPANVADTDTNNGAISPT